MTEGMGDGWCVGKSDVFFQGPKVSKYYQILLFGVGQANMTSFLYSRSHVQKLSPAPQAPKKIEPKKQSNTRPWLAEP